MTTKKKERGIKKEKVLCASCKIETNHAILAEHETSGSEYDGQIQWWNTYQIIQCMGCEEISFREVSANTEDYDLRTGEPEEFTNLYPNRISGRDPIEGSEAFPMSTKRVYLETLKALNNGTPLLAAIGLRALIESICLEQKTKGKNLAKRIDELADMGLLSTKQAEFFHAHRFMGNEAAHEIVAPKPQHLIAALDIAETLLKTIYVLPDLADTLKQSKKT